MQLLRICRTSILLSLINLVILARAGDSGPNWSAIKMLDLIIKKLGPEIDPETNFDLYDSDDGVKARGYVKLNENISPETRVKWIARYMNPDDNQLKTQAESESTGLCDFLVFQAPVAQMFFQDSNITSCPFQKGVYVFPGSGPVKEAFPKRIPKGRDVWEIEVIADKWGKIVVHFIIKAELMR